MTEAGEPRERRVLVLAPTGKDATLAQTVLRRTGIACDLCPDVASLAASIESGAGAVLLTEEAIANGSMEVVASIIQHQPPWSDLPVLVLTRTGSDSPIAAKALNTLGNVTLLERPVRIAALASAVRAALRARERQYQTRSHLREREDANHRKDEFLATLSHELRNPLAPLRHAVQVLRQFTGDSSDPAQVCAMMDRQLAHLARLVDDLLEVSRITRGKIELRCARVSLASIVDAAIETSLPLIDSARHRLDVRLPEEPLYLEADGTRLAQVFANLLNNAAKYTDDGGRIVLDAERAADSVIVSVRDNGMGIPAEALPHVFDMFVQADGTRGRAQGGLGIGLTLARTLVEMHGGTVVASSGGAGKGSVFAVSLPLSLAATGADAPAPRGTASIETPLRILCVDDNHDAADMLGLLLKMLGAQVAIAHDGPAALEALDTHQPAVVFLDLGMPGMDGYEVARRIRQHPRCGQAILIALSGWGQEKDLRQSRDAGFDHHLIKPADIETVRQLLRSAATPVVS